MKRKGKIPPLDSYADIPGVPYPEQPLKSDDLILWFEGQKKILKRMQQQEKQIVAELKEALEHIKTQEEFDAFTIPLKAAASQLDSRTVSIRSFTIVSPSGVNYNIAVMFQSRRDVTQKDEEPKFGIMVM